MSSSWFWRKTGHRLHCKSDIGDRTGICICMDIAISAYYFCILKILCTLYWIYSQYSDKCWTCSRSLQVPYRVIQDCCLDYFLQSLLGRVSRPITYCFIYLDTCRNHLYHEGMVAVVYRLKNIPRDGTTCHFQALLEVRIRQQWAHGTAVWVWNYESEHKWYWRCRRSSTIKINIFFSGFFLKQFFYWN